MSTSILPPPLLWRKSGCAPETECWGADGIIKLDGFLVAKHPLQITLSTRQFVCPIWQWCNGSQSAYRSSLLPFGCEALVSKVLEVELLFNFISSFGISHQLGLLALCVCFSLLMFSTPKWHDFMTMPKLGNNQLFYSCLFLKFLLFH